MQHTANLAGIVVVVYHSLSGDAHINWRITERASPTLLCQLLRSEWPQLSSC
jgi:hypothetical protein